MKTAAAETPPITYGKSCGCIVSVSVTACPVDSKQYVEVMAIFCQLELFYVSRFSVDMERRAVSL